MMKFSYLNHSFQLLDSKDLRDINLKWWRSQVGIVTQEPTLFNVSIAENLAYGDLSRQVPMSEIIEAAKNANIHDFIQQLPQVYRFESFSFPWKNLLLTNRVTKRVLARKVINSRVVRSNA